MVKEVTCWKSCWFLSKETKTNSAAANAKTDAARALLRAGAPAMIKMAATIGQKMTKRTISGKRRNRWRRQYLVRTGTRMLAGSLPGSAAAAHQVPKLRGCCHRLRRYQ